MNKLILTKDNSSALMVNTETMEITSVARVNDHIDYTYISPCDCQAILGDKSIDIEEGDIIFKLYTPIGNDRELIVVKSREFTDYINNYEKIRNEHYEYEELNCQKVCCGSTGQVPTSL